MRTVPESSYRQIAEWSATAIEDTTNDDPLVVLRPGQRGSRFRRVVTPLPDSADHIPRTVLCFIFSWTEFLFSLTLTQTNIKTVPVVSSTFVTSIGTAWGNMAALGAAAIVPAFIVILLVQRHLVRGLTMGSLKQ